MTPESLDIAGIVSDLNRTVHEPARLAILTVLSACDSADFVFLKAAAGRLQPSPSQSASVTSWRTTGAR